MSTPTMAMRLPQETIDQLDAHARHLTEQTGRYVSRTRALVMLVSQINQKGEYMPDYGPVPSDMPVSLSAAAPQMTDILSPLRGPDKFLMRAIGDTMKSRGILDGDHLVFVRTNKLKSGQIILFFDETGLNLRVLKERNTPSGTKDWWVEPLSPDHAPGVKPSKLPPSHSEHGVYALLSVVRRL